MNMDVFFSNCVKPENKYVEFCNDILRYSLAHM